MNNLNIAFGNNDHSLLAVIPSQQLLKKSVQITAPNKQFSEWQECDHAASYSFMRRIVQAWEKINFSTQYLVYGKIDAEPFRWEVVPYQKCSNWIGRIIQQLQVLFRIAFGGFYVSEKSCQEQLHHDKALFEKQSEVVTIADPSSSKSDDAFCKADTIERQWVVAGKTVNVLFSYAPIGFGGERRDFLLVPKAHRESFTDVTAEEYSEALVLTTKLLDHFTARKRETSAYLFHKTGLDAGQGTKHWNLQLIFTESIAQDFWGKLTVMKNILFGASPLGKEELAEKVQHYRKEFATL